ncbi:toll/interleukin-1 receptor domain-containing protein, partial [Frankia sp. Cas4]|uniref:toll/interleukin-1 receptor domain-containing protein n=1 Tax=Frankia sp. Cas4 TaxID=3073927 RepID=UPI002AD1FECD
MNGGHGDPPADRDHPADCGGASPPDRWDFFVSYAAADRTWAEWIAWQLEDAGFQVLIQAWDFVPGSHWMTRMADGVRGADRVIAVLSYAYSRSPYERAVREEAFAVDPDGRTRRVIPIRVEDCPCPVLLNRVRSFDLFGLSEDEARSVLLDRIHAAVDGRGKPPTEPLYP